MTTPETNASCKLKPFPWLVRSRNINVLWMVRMLVHLSHIAGPHGNVISISDDILQRLRIAMPTQRTEDEKANLRERLVLTLKQMECNARKYRFSCALEANLKLLGKKIGLTTAERSVLALAVLLRADAEMFAVAQCCRDQVNTSDQVSTIIRMPVMAIATAISPRSRLRRSGLVKVGGGGTPAENLVLRRGGLRNIAFTRLAFLDELFSSFLHASPAASLSREDYSHLTPDFGFVSDLIGEALATKRSGVNVLLYGPPGTGKTELARTIAKELDLPLYDVSSEDEDGSSLDPNDRLGATATAQSLLCGRRAILVIDEVDTIFNDGSPLAGKPATAGSVKAWVNDLLERNQVPAIWIANGILSMDSAFLRRFDLVIKLDTPPLKQRLRLLERECGDFLDTTQLRRFARVDTATPAVIVRAANVARRVKESEHPRSEIMETILDGTLQAQGHSTVRRTCRGVPPAGYDITLCNANLDLESLASGMARAKIGRVCLYGPPGTGKTAFGYWLASTLDKPLVLKRTSDLQSPFVGVMEKNLARAFEQAAQDEAVLQIDEVDSFLRDRRHAQRSWEVSQVNEFLTQLESFDGIFIASTNLMDGLDQAALRRFDHKIRLGYMRPEQSMRMFCRCLRDWGISIPTEASCRRELANMTTLTPGDFAVIARRHMLMPFENATTALLALRDEIDIKGGASHRIGFL